MGAADLHVHTSHSWDASADVERVLRRAAEVGLNLLAITDHNTIAGAIEAREIARFLNNGVEVIIGEELDTLQGHLIGLFLTDCIPARLSFRDTLRRIHEQGGLAVVPHPGGPLPWHATQKRVAKHSGQLDALEVTNSSWFTGNGRKSALYRDRVAHGLAVTGGSDAHCLAAVGQCVTIFPGGTSSDLRSALQRRQTSAAGEPLPFVKGLYSLGVKTREIVGKGRFVETPHYETLTSWARLGIESASNSKG